MNAPDQNHRRAAMIAAGAYCAAAGCFFALAGKAASGTVGYAIAGVLFAAAAAASFLRSRRSTQ